MASKTKAQGLAVMKQEVGKRHSVDLKGVSNDYGSQCVAWVSWYLTYLGYPSVMKNDAIMIFHNNPLKLKRVSPGELQAGDIGFMQFGSTGHTFTVYSRSGNTLTTYDQNYAVYDEYNGSPLAQCKHSVYETIGGFRPQYKGVTEMFTADQVNSLIASVFNRQSTAKERSLYTKNSIDVVLGEVFKNSKTQRAKASQYDSVKARVEALTKELNTLKAQKNPDIAKIKSLVKQLDEVVNKK